jgi:site-specific recombinase XerD
MNVHPSIDQWLAELERQGKSQATIAGYRRALAHFVRWSEQTYGQAFDPAAIIPRDVADWKTRQQTVEDAAPATINTRLTALSQYFTWAVAEDIARSDPTVHVSGLRLPARRPKALDEVYVRRLLRQVNQAGEPRDVAILELLLGTGLRVSELLALRVGDLTLGERSGEVVVRRGKGGVHRRVPLTAPVRRALRAYLDGQPKLKEGDPLWVGERGPLRDRSGIYNLLKKYAHRARLDPDEISPHVLRHTMATRYLAANPDDLRGLAAILGHADLNTVMIYTEPSTADLAARMEKAENV